MGISFLQPQRMKQWSSPRCLHEQVVPTIVWWREVREKMPARVGFKRDIMDSGSIMRRVLRQLF